MNKVVFCMTAACFTLFGAIGSKAADAEAGRKVFNKCAVCHSTESGVTRVGPSLYGVVGRKAGSLPNFNYSSAITAIVVGAGSVGLGWGNGKATAVLFAREGARVLYMDINADAVAETVAIITEEGGNLVCRLDRQWIHSPERAFCYGDNQSGSL